MIAPYEPRFGRARPVVAVIGENKGTEFTDYVIPYSLLAQSGSADVFALAIENGPVTMRPTSVRMQPHATTGQFDLQFPQGADYVIVPAVSNKENPQLLAWIAAQYAKGATMVSICDGAFLLAQAGLLKDRRATAHWFTDGMRRQQFPDTQWLTNTRYVVDGTLVSSAGISAAIPTSLALVEAIAGRARAQELGAQYGVADWSSAHNSDVFIPRFGVNLLPYATTEYLNKWLFKSETVGVQLAPGVDDILLALTMDAFSRTGRSRAYAIAAGDLPVATRSGLKFYPDRIKDERGTPDRMASLAHQAPSTGVLDQVLADIAAAYGNHTAAGVAYAFEYPLMAR